MFELRDFFVSMPQEKYSVRNFEVLVLLLLTFIAATLSFYGLGSTGFHGDEETMALPVRSILDNGLPILPSDMFYSRGMSQLYLMALSVSIFGESEWALRLPSAILYCFLPLCAWVLGRRFLSPVINLFFVAVITLLPENIEAAQTARFYLFYLFTVIVFTVLALRWNETQKFLHLIQAVLVFALGLDYQPLMLFSLALFGAIAFIDYTPSKFYYSVLGIFLCCAAYLAHNAFVEYMYQHSTILINAEPSAAAGTATIASSSTTAIQVVSTSVLLILAVFLGLRSFQRNGTLGLVCVLVLSASIVASASSIFFLAGLMLLFGLLISLRLRSNFSISLMAIVALCASVLISTLESGGADLGSLSIAIKNGTEKLSIWPWVVFFDQFRLGSLVHISLLICAAFVFVQSKKLPYVLAMYLVAVALPITVIGAFEWYPPRRYMYGFVPLFILTTFALLQYFLLQYRNPKQFSSAVVAIIFSLVSISILRPASVWAVVGKGCATIANECDRPPDHRGQAGFLKSLSDDEKKLIIVEDILQQTYYFGTVDYWLLGPQHANQFVRKDNDRLVDMYTSTETLNSDQALRSVFEKYPRPTIYLVMNPEAQLPNGEGSSHFTADMNSTLRGFQKELIYSGPSGREKIWRIPAVKSTEN